MTHSCPSPDFEYANLLLHLIWSWENDGGPPYYLAKLDGGTVTNTFKMNFCPFCGAKL